MSRTPALLIIYTGGTIGMMHDKDNGSLRPLPFNHILDEIPELNKANCKLSSITFEPPIDSSNMNPEAWIKIASIIEENYENYHGFIVLHGTDTMAYSASALSFMLDNLNKPVIFTGSQLPIGSLRTDAKENIISAVEVASATKNGKALVPEVCILFQSGLFRANRTSKFNSEEFKAFQSYNFPRLADIGVNIKYNLQFILKPNNSAAFVAHKAIDTNVAILKLFPGISKEAVSAVLNITGLRGIVLETFGAGNAPSAKWFVQELKDALNRGVIILSVTQCAEGAVEMGMYETSLALEESGIVGGHDITSEAAITKLMCLLGRNKNRKKIIFDLNRAISGEITI